jgi:transcriptional regulator with PAS, ATPase and Fis domain
LANPAVWIAYKIAEKEHLWRESANLKACWHDKKTTEDGFELMAEQPSNNKDDTAPSVPEELPGGMTGGLSARRSLAELALSDHGTRTSNDLMTLPEVGSPLPLDDDRSSKRISLLIYHHAESRAVLLAEGESVTIGRDESATLSIDDKRLSRHHARFVVEHGAVWVEDLGSTNGTQVNGNRLQRCKLTTRDTVTMGSVQASIHILGVAPAEEADHDLFWAAVELEVQRARFFGRPASLLLLRTGIPLGMRAIEKIQKTARPIDRVAFYSLDVVELLLPECDDVRARGVAAAILEALGTSEEAATIALSVFPQSATSASEMMQTALTALHEAEAGSIAIAPALHEGREHGARDEAPVVRNARMVELYDTVMRVANSEIPVLVMGETGTGKEVLARVIHENSPRSQGRMMSVNCGAIPENLVESTLFGHERGAFTGAASQKQGIFEAANGGTVLLDEVGELPLAAQVALLRVLESKTLMRVGSTKEVAVDARVIAATNRDLEKMCDEGTFRWDLYYRLNTFTLSLPALRERPDEIAPLVTRFIEHANTVNGRSIEGVSEQAMRLLHRYPWPGNVRELRNAIERAVVIARHALISPSDLPGRVQRIAELAAGDELATERADAEQEASVAGSKDDASVPIYASDGTLDLRERVREFETRLILEALERAEGNRREAADLINLPLRTLANKISKLGIKKGYE